MFKESGYTGAILEQEVFNKIEKKKYPHDMENYVNYKVSIKIAKDAQPYEDPSDPDPQFANDLHATVAELLKLEDYSSLRLYTAVGSHLDVYHSVDAFFELDTDNGIITVTLDVTKNISKGEEHRADVVFQMPPDGLDPKLEEDKEQYKEKIDEVSQRVLDEIQNILNKNNRR